MPHLRRTLILPGLALALLVGCGSSETTTPEGESAEASAPVVLTAEEIAQIEKLPEADRAAALAQKVCPVTGEHLGSMGMPIKESVLGQTIYLCCKGCTEDARDDPLGTLSKLKK